MLYCGRFQLSRKTMKDENEIGRPEPLSRIVSAMGNGSAKTITLYSLVECLTQRRREAESAEKSQKSEGKERYDKKRPGNFFHPIGENNYDTN